ARGPNARRPRRQRPGHPHAPRRGTVLQGAGRRGAKGGVSRTSASGGIDSLPRSSQDEPLRPAEEDAMAVSDKRVAIIGSGLIGRAWAIVFAGAGCRVALHDSVQGVAARAKNLVAEGLRELAAQGFVADPDGAAARVRAAADLADALAGASLVQENTPETVEAKRAIFAEFDRLAAPDAILASSTSSIVASLFTEGLRGRHRCLVAHPVNPPHLVPLVELVGAPWTTPETVAAAKRSWGAWGRGRWVVGGELGGSTLTRLQAVLLSEAFRLVQSGHVTPQDLDKTLKDGLGMRWSFMGPFETIELNAPAGIPDYCARYGPSLARLSAADPAIYAGEHLAHLIKLWGGAPTPHQVAARMAWRDRRLAALKAHKRAQPSD